MKIDPIERLEYSEQRVVNGLTFWVHLFERLGYNGCWNRSHYVIEFQGHERRCYGWPTDSDLVKFYEDLKHEG